MFGATTFLRGALERRCSGSVLAAGIAVAVLFLAITGYGFDVGWMRSWRALGVPSMLPPFLDLHGVTDNAACAARGINPYSVRWCDVNDRGYNYTPIWLLLGKLGIGSDQTPWLALAFEIPTLMLIVLLMRGRPARYGITALLAVLSPSVMLAFERGNNDLLIWSLVCCAALLFAERHIIRLAAAYALLAFAVVLKLFPIFCCALALRVTRSAVVVALALAVSSLFYFYSIAHLFPIIRRNTDYTTILSFGYIILFVLIELYAAPRFGFDAAGLYQSWIPTGVLLLVLILAVSWAFIAWRREARWCRISESTEGTAFLFGAGIFLGSFVFLGTNYAYRMTFLLLCLPQMFEWCERASSAPQGTRVSGDYAVVSSRVAWLFVGCCIASMWLKLAWRWFGDPLVSLVDQAADWLLIAIITWLFVLNGLYALSDALPKVRWSTRG